MVDLNYLKRKVKSGTTARWDVIDYLIKKNNLNSGIEIGTWKGETYKFLLKNNKNLKLVGIDSYCTQPENKGPEKWTAGENGHSWDHETYYNDLTKFCEKLNNGSYIIKGYSNNVYKSLKKEKFDFIFIDGDHSKRGVFEDIKNYYPLIKDGGFILGHDINWKEVKYVVSKFFGNSLISKMYSYEEFDDFVWCVKKPKKIFAKIFCEINFKTVKKLIKIK